MYMKYHIYLELRTKCKLFMKKDSPHIMKDKKKILHDETVDFLVLQPVRMQIHAVNINT